jgi:hypothetical protein
MALGGVGVLFDWVAAFLQGTGLLFFLTGMDDA